MILDITEWNKFKWCNRESDDKRSLENILIGESARAVFSFRETTIWHTNKF